MAMQPLWQVLEELREEQHAPMIALLDALRQHDWATTLRYDLSMFRLWIARPGVDAVEVMVVYGDGRGGGRPLKPYVDAFETTIFLGPGRPNVKIGTRENTIQSLRKWLESAGVPGSPPG